MGTIVYVMYHDSDINNPRDEWDHIGTLYTWHSRYTLGGKKDVNNAEHIEDLNLWAFERFSIPGLEQFSTDRGYLEQYATPEQEALFEEQGDDYDPELRELVDYYEPTAEGLAYFNKTVEDWLAENVCIKSVYMYDHGGITIRTSSFSCPWDSGQVGIIYATKADAEKDGYDWERMGETLESEVRELDQCLTGDVWGFREFTVPAEDATEWEIESDIYDEDSIPEGLLDEWETDSCWGYYGYEYLKDKLEARLSCMSGKPSAS